MASMVLGIATTIQGGSIALDATDAAAAAPSQVVYHVPPPSQIPAAPSGTSQQDTVTLSGTAPAIGSGANSNRFVQVAAFTLLAQEFTFPPDTSAEGAGVAAATNSVSNSTLADQTAALQQQAPLFTHASANATAIAVATTSAQSPTNSDARYADTSAANSVSASNANGGVTASQETLQQLDRELQRLGINPQDISLMNRMALLFWVNDPAALRQFVQGMQPSAASSQSNTSSAASTTANQTQSVSTTTKLPSDAQARSQAAQFVQPLRPIAQYFRLTLPRGLPEAVHSEPQALRT